MSGFRDCKGNSIGLIINLINSTMSDKKTMKMFFFEKSKIHQLNSYGKKCRSVYNRANKKGDSPNDVARGDIAQIKYSRLHYTKGGDHGTN